MRAGQGLNILVRVEIGIQNDYSVCSSKIDTNTASSGGQEECEDRRVRGVECINSPLLLQTTNTAIKSAVVIAQAPKEILNDIQLL